MNIHKPKNANTDWASIEFIGKPFILDNYKFIKIKEKGTNKTGFYSFDKNIIYFTNQGRGTKLNLIKILNNY